MRLVLVGPPGAGKGTQAALLSRKLAVPHISTGDLFRQHINDRTPLGREAERYLDVGELVPDHITNDMVRRRLAEDDAREGFLLDGFPRTLQQVDVLSDILAENGAELNAVLEFSVPEHIVVARLLSRGRPDDTEDLIKHRQQVYRDETAPLLDSYTGIHVKVHAVGPVEEIAERVLGTIAMPHRTSRAREKPQVRRP
ncbi:adenylate kinase [Streptomyces decoyicus]|uniref:adenylate kinase n=1 Tax=Streptomyces decoyicus TaxID=249567 RepID=UPI0033BB0EEA